MKDVHLPCPCCCNHIHMTREEWINGGVFTCKKCGWHVRVQKHTQILAAQEKKSPLREIKIFGRRKPSVNN